MPGGAALSAVTSPPPLRPVAAPRGRRSRARRRPGCAAASHVPDPDRRPYDPADGVPVDSAPSSARPRDHQRRQGRGRGRVGAVSNTRRRAVTSPSHRPGAGSAAGAAPACPSDARPPPPRSQLPASRSTPATRHHERRSHARQVVDAGCQGYYATSTTPAATTPTPRPRPPVPRHRHLRRGAAAGGRDAPDARRAGQVRSRTCSPGRAP